MLVITEAEVGGQNVRKESCKKRPTYKSLNILRYKIKVVLEKL